MNTLDDRTGTLEAVLGSGWISRHEASKLEAGMAIRSERLAGEGQTLVYAGARMASYDMAVIDAGGASLMCPRLRSLEEEGQPEPEPVRGAEMTELLPFRILLGRAEARLADLSGLGRGSWIDMGIQAGAEEDAVLLLCGCEAARGRTCVIGENMGLRLTRILARAEPGAEFRSTGNLLEAGYAAEKVADYNFRRPDFFTRRQIQALEEIHLDFLRSLAVTAPGRLPGLELALVDQLNFQEFLDSLPKDGRKLAIAPACPSVPRPDRPMPAKPILRLASGPFPEEEVLGWIRRDISRPVGGAVLAQGPALDGDAASVFAALRDAWKRRGALAPIQSSLMSIPDSGYTVEFEPYAERYEMVALAGFRAGKDWVLNIAYPARVLESVMKALSR
jgi:hypothetical protein